MSRLEDSNIFNIKSFDKSNFVCIKFPDSSMYYGELVYFHKNGTLVLKKINFKITNFLKIEDYKEPVLPNNATEEQRKTFEEEKS
jgi:hypothetical protein